MGDEAAVDTRAEAWQAFSEEECATIAMGLTLVALDAMYDITGSGEVASERRKAEIMLVVAELMDSMADRMEGPGIDRGLVAGLREKIATMDAAEGDAE